MITSCTVIPQNATEGKKKKKVFNFGLVIGHAVWKERITRFAFPEG